MSAAPGVAQFTEIDRKQADYDAFASQCAGIDRGIDFFPENGAGIPKAKKVCLGCPVKQQCLDYAMKYDERHGVWGSLDASQRKALRRAGMGALL
jgi:hypothetical protein